MTSIYYVWRRSSTKAHLNGYVSSTCYDPSKRPGQTDTETFEVLLITKDWPDARALIKKERAA